MYDAAQGHWRQMQIPPVVGYRMKHRAHMHQQCLSPSVMCRLSCLGPDLGSWLAGLRNCINVSLIRLAYHECLS